MSFTENETILYHYTAFRNLHHSIELLIKGIFGITKEKHELILLIEMHPYKVNNFFTVKELALLRQSDDLNLDKGQLSYYEDPHKIFDWSIFFT